MEGSAEPDPGDRGNEIDDVVGALADKRRRFVLYLLAQQEAPIPLSTLSERLAEWLGRGYPNDIQTRLYHSHLPKLEATGLITLDVGTNLVRITSKGRLVDDCREAYVEQLDAACS